MIESVKEFHETYGLPVLDTPTLVPDRHKLRLALIVEEAEELAEAMDENDLVGIADALGDLAYVVIGAALEFGIPLEEVVDEIHLSNMSKLGAGGKPIYRESDGKVLKGPNYSPPNIAKVLGVENVT